MEPRILVLLALAAAANAGPITVQENTCATECSPSTKFNYAPGTTYLYDYKVNTETSMSGASEDSAKLTLTATAELEVLGPCEMSLTLRDTHLSHSEPAGGLKTADMEDDFRRGLESSSLRFSFQDGVVNHICSSGREEAWALNIKKGVLSAFQNSMENLNQAQNVTETDVAGICETEYKVISSGYYTNSVRKVKNILTCADRHEYDMFFPMVSYNIPSELQNIPLMKTSHECDHEIQIGGVLQSSICTESHVYRPFSNGQSGGSTTVKQALTYKTYKNSVSSKKAAILNRNSLVFDRSSIRPTPDQGRQMSEQILKEICESTSFDIRPESPLLFSELVKAIKALDKQTMEDTLMKLKTKSLCPTNNKAYKQFLDAMPMAGTSASVSLMSSLIVNEDVTGLQAKAWIASLAFIKAPTSEMLLDAKALIDNEKIREEALLPVSSMVNNFCTRTSACDQSYAVLSIMASLERNIGQYCDTTGKNFYPILLTLRAFGNAGHSTRSVPTINKCLSSSYNPLEIRVAAAEAFRRMPCDAEDTELWTTFENGELDSELRIQAYLALMRCPSDKTLGKMAASLDSELNDQVGAFVYSHLTNLKETSDPHKQDVVRAMNNLVIPSKFESSPMKASSNLEASALINKINTGFVAESNLIWSNAAQLPRSASANLTVELFGQSINLVDFGGRLEGLDYLIKSLFGSYMEGLETKPSDENVQGSIYARLFGNEMFFMHSKHTKSPLEKLPENWLDLLITLSKKQDFAMTYSHQIMEASMFVPTSAGLPIDVFVNGSAVVDLVLNGKADLRKAGSSPRSMDIDGEIRPSAALEITGAMAVDAHVTRTGLRMRNTLHTSTSLKGRIQMERGQQLNIELDTPQEKMEIFDASSKFFIVHNGVEQEQKMITENRQEFEYCTCDKMAEITGAMLCGQVSFPNASQQTEGPYFPLTGPSSASIVLRKTDTHSSYKLLAKRVENKKMSVAQLSFNTPGSREDRAILVDMTINYPNQEIDAQLVTPWAKLATAGAVTNKRDLKSITGRFTIDDSIVYAFTSEVKVSKSNSKLHLSPMIEITKPGMDNVQLNGFISMEKPFKSMDVDLSLNGLQKLPYNVKATVSNTKKERSLTASFSDDGGKSQYSVEANNRFTLMGKKTTILSTSNVFKLNTPKREIVSISGSADYKEDKALKLSGSMDIHKLMKKPATFNLSVLKNSKKRGTRFDVDANIKSNAISSRLDSYMFIKSSGLISSKASLDYTIPKVAKNKIILSGKLNDRSTKAYTKYTVKSTLDVKKNPEYNMGVNINFDNKKKQSEVELDVKYGPNFRDKSKRIYLNAELNRKIPNYKNAVVSYKLKAQAPEHDVDVSVAGKHTHTPKMVDSDVKLTYGKNKDVTASVLLKNKSGKTSNLNGRASIAWPGSEYVLSSQLDQKAAKINHGITLKGSNGMKHSIDSVYKKTGGKGHTFSTVLNLQGLKRTTLTGSANLAPKNLKFAGEVKYGKDAYGLSTETKRGKTPGGTMTIEAFNPDRRVVLKVNGDKNDKECGGSIEASWDADNDKNKKITLGGSIFNNPKKSVVLGADATFTSPFENYENLAGSMKYIDDEDKHDVSGKFNWGGKNKQMTTSLSLKKPFSLGDLTASFEAKSPFKKIRSVSADISHSWNDALKTTIKGNLNKENAKLTIQGEGRLDDLKGSASLSSTIKDAEEISGSFTHKHGSGNIENTASLLHNGKSYGYKFDMDHRRNGWKIRNKGNLMFEEPKSKFSANWQHKNTLDDIKSSLTSQWGKKSLGIQLSGSHDLKSTRNINGELKIQSPWKSMREVIVAINHRHGNDLLKSKASLVHNGATKALSDIKFAKNGQNTDLDFTLTSPFHEDINGKLNSQYGSHPMTSSMELRWHPRKQITADASLKAESLNDAAVELKLTTPIRDYPNINLRASNKKEGSEMVSHANLNYGARKSIDLEARHNLYGENKMARVRFTTPFNAIKSLDAGLNFNGHATNFASNADFELLPNLGKFQGSAQWRYDSDLSGKLRLDTPCPEYPYFELTTSSQDKGKHRDSRVEVKMHPHQVYSLESQYSQRPFDLPLFFEATVRSPYPTYDNLGVVLRHNHSPTGVATSGELRYLEDKKIEAGLNADWSNNVEGSLIVNTPFRKFENSRISVRHEGDLKDFKSHGEINVAQKSVVADASFQSGYTTSGTFSLSTPVSGMENVNMEFKKRGRAKNFKGEAEFSVNDKKFNGNYQHKFTKDGLKASVKLNTPVTEQLKMSLDHSGMPARFTNEISASYGRKYDLDSVVSFDYSQPDVTGHGTLKYKMGKSRNTARLSFNKNGALRDMSFGGTAGLNDDEVTVSGSWKNRGGIEGNVQVNTPFKGFKATGVSFSHAGSLNDFVSSADMTYMDDHNINGKLAFSRDGVKKMRLDSEIATPFKQFPSASLTFNHNYDEYRNALNGDASLTTPVGSFGSGSLTYVKTGGLDNLDVVTTANRNGRRVANLKLANIFSGQELHSNLGVELAELPDLTIGLDHMGNLDNFNTKATAKLGDDSVKGEVFKRGSIEDLSFGANAGYNDEAVEVSGTWNTQRGIDGNLEVKTPFDRFNDVGMSVSHTSSPSDCSSSITVEYMDDKTITGKIDFSHDDNVRLSTELTTPFQGFEMTRIEANSAMDNDIDAKVSLTTTVNEFGTGEASLSKSGNLDNLVVDGKVLRNNVEIVNLRVTNDQGYNDLKTSISGRCNNYPEVNINLDHSGDLNQFNTKVHAALGDRNAVDAEASFDNRGQSLDGEMALSYDIENFGSNKASLAVSKDGQLDNFNVKVTGKVNDKESTVTGEMKLKPDITGSLTINTPVKGYKNVGIFFKHDGSLEKFNCEGRINLVDGEQFSGKLDFYRNKNLLIETNLEVNTPIQGVEFTKFEYRHDGQQNSFTCYASLLYGDSKKITYDMSAATKPNMDFSVSLSTPFKNYESLVASTNLDASWPKMSIRSKLDAGKNREITLRGSLDASKAISGDLSLTTPVQGFRDIGFNFEHSGKPKNFKSEGRVTYMDGKDISGKVVFKLRRPYVSVEVKTPFSGFELTKLEGNHATTDADSTTTTYLVYGSGNVVSTDTVLTYAPKPGFSVSVKTPIPEYEELMASASVDNSWPKVEFTSKAKVGMNRQFSLDANLDTANDISGSVEIKTPLNGFSHIGASFLHSGNLDSFNTEGKLTYMDGKDISSKVSFYKYMWRRLVATAELSTPFSGVENTKAEINYEDNSNTITTSAAMEYAQGEKLDGTLKLTYSPSYEALLTLNTPFRGFKAIRAQSSLDLTAPSYSAGYNLNYGYNTESSAKGKLNLYSIYNVDGTLEVVLPLQGMEFTKVEYQHKFDSSRIDGTISLTYGNSQVISTELKVSNVSKYDATITVKTPFDGFENVQGSATFDNSYDKYDASSSLSFNRNRAFSIDSGLDLSTEPYRASVQVNTPYNDFRNMELVLTHEGGLQNFHCTGFFSSPLTNNINADAMLKYKSPSEMEASATLKSNFDGMDELVAEIKNSEVANEMRSHALVGWTAIEQIVFDGLVRMKENYYENKYSGEMSLSTPFVDVKNFALQLEHTGKEKELTQMIGLDLNGDKLLDMSAEYSSKDIHEASVTFRQPRAMKYTVSARSNNGLTETEILADWNRDKMDNNVHITASMNDQSDSYKTDRNVDIEVEHASRKMGVVHKHACSGQETTSSGKVYWDSDDTSRVFYDMQVQDNSRRQKQVKDGHFTLGLPSRTLKLAGSCSDNQASRSADATFSWDADREDQQVGMKGTITRGERVKGDITLSMPNIRKEFRVDGELMTENGRVILDARTDIFYSKDSRKTLTLTSKLEDISDYYSRYNYSLAVGVSHPYTNVDIQMKSHLGSSDEKMTVALSTDYLTARRQNKNLGLLVEINKLKRQINLKVTNPMNKLEIVGDVVSTRPYKVRMLSKVDDTESFRSDFTLDEDKKTIELNLFEGSNGLNLWAGYPNKTAFRTELRRVNYGREMTESLLAVRLNTTRLLHTRLHWNPNLVEEIRQGVMNRAIDDGEKAAKFLEEINMAISGELSGKYEDITSHLKEEMESLIQLIEKEMTQLSRTLNKLSKQLQKSYRNNDYYLQDMGEVYQQTQSALKAISREYRQTSAEVIEALRGGIQSMTSFSIQEHYNEFVNSGVSWINENVERALLSLESCLAKADAALTEYHEKVIQMRQKVSDTVYNATYVTYISNHLSQLGDIDLNDYMPTLKVPERYTTAIYNARGAINSKLTHVLSTPGLSHFKSRANELYQEGVWAYNYWELEENIYNHAHNILKLLREIVQDEMKEYVQDLQALYENPITVWDPEHGEIQAEFKLPLDVACIDEIPDLSPLVEKVRANMPDTKALENMAQTVSDIWGTSGDEDKLTEQLKKYKPTKRMRKVKKGRKYKVRRARS